MSLTWKIVDFIGKWEKRFLLILVGALAINAATIPVTYMANSLVNSETKTAVFTSGSNDLIPNPIISTVVDFFMYTPVTLRQTISGNEVYWYSNATKEKILEVLENPEYTNIIFIGHGTKSSYRASNGDLGIDDLFTRNLPRRKGEFIQHTCGNDIGKRSLGEVLYPDGSGGYGFNELVAIESNYARAWKMIMD
ncbi:hypothetical protein COV17_02520 [Candidatus Woesearchaeota archaeon CG10_big_fil_rev_8_21_14_0_10_36_11]|nr:MAG: hypothetical protein COV17_02520 [Candidatus Woesearchaeota archaeon CG10_big_fil_rev_8_21_14_0_10_36_11]